MVCVLHHPGLQNPPHLNGLLRGSSLGVNCGWRFMKCSFALFFSLSTMSILSSLMSYFSSGSYFRLNNLVSPQLFIATPYLLGIGIFFLCFPDPPFFFPPFLFFFYPHPLYSCHFLFSFLLHLFYFHFLYSFHLLNANVV